MPKQPDPIVKIILAAYRRGKIIMQQRKEQTAQPVQPSQTSKAIEPQKANKCP